MRPTWRIAAVLLAVTLAHSAAAQTADTAGFVAAHFRVFDGIRDVTASSRLRVMPAGARDEAVDVSDARVDLPPAMYDVQVLHQGPGGVVAIKWAERLSVIHYPDEGGRHLEVINLRQGFGALQLRQPEGIIEPSEVTLFPAGDADVPVGRAIAGEDYVLFVVPAGRYDVRVEHAEHGGNADTHWLLDVEVPTDRTRLKLVAAPEP